MNILVAFDGSDGAEAALRVAATLARAAHARLLLLHALNPLTDAAGIVAETTAEAMRVLTARERAALGARTAAVEGVTAEPLVEQLQHGEDVVGCIDRIAAAQQVDLIAIGSRRASGLRGLALGSITQHLLRKSERPVLVVRP